MEFPIYTTRDGGISFSKIISPYQSIVVIGNNILYQDYGSVTSPAFHSFVLKQTSQECTREEFMEAYNKAIETINSKL